MSLKKKPQEEKHGGQFSAERARAVRDSGRPARVAALRLWLDGQRLIKIYFILNTCEHNNALLSRALAVNHDAASLFNSIQ